jgi:hypothetical protein
MSRLPPDLRAGLRVWADHPPRLDATTAARRARAAAVHTRPGALRIAAGAITAAAFFALGLVFATRLDRAPPPVAAASALDPYGGVALATPGEPRLVVIELSSGTPLYVVLPPAARRPT